VSYGFFRLDRNKEHKQVSVRSLQVHKIILYIITVLNKRSVLKLLLKTNWKSSFCLEKGFENLHKDSMTNNRKKKKNSTLSIRLMSLTDFNVSRKETISSSEQRKNEILTCQGICHRYSNQKIWSLIILKADPKSNGMKTIQCDHNIFTIYLQLDQATKPMPKWCQLM
jgi:hypothetical protein